MSVCPCLLSRFSCVRLCDPIDCSPPGSSVHGNSPGKNTGVGCGALLQGIFPTQESTPCFLCLLHWQMGSLPAAPRGNPKRYHRTHQVFRKATVSFVSPSPKSSLSPAPCCLISRLSPHHSWSSGTCSRLPVSAYAVPAWDGLFPFPHQPAPSPLTARLTGHLPQSVPPFQIITRIMTDNILLG